MRGGVHGLSRAIKALFSSSVHSGSFSSSLSPEGLLLEEVVSVSSVLVTGGSSPGETVLVAAAVEIVVAEAVETVAAEAEAVETVVEGTGVVRVVEEAVVVETVETVVVEAVETVVRTVVFTGLGLDDSVFGLSVATLSKNQSMNLYYNNICNKTYTGLNMAI